ncbi:MAG: hypothetical protein ACT4PS_15620 [Betaproteobacteria bacterium]
MARAGDRRRHVRLARRDRAERNHDGLACDFHEFMQYDLPVWCRGEAALTGKSLAADGALNVSVSCGGVAVQPGDAVLADSGGVFFCSKQEIDEIYETALPMQQREPKTLKRLWAGEKLGAISGASVRVEAAGKNDVTGRCAGKNR